MTYAEGEIFKDTLKGIFLSSLLCMACLYIPVIGFLFALLIPLPVLFYSSKLGRKTGLIVSGTTIFIIICVLRTITIDLVFFAELLFLGFMLSEFFRVNLSVERTIAYACCAVLATGIISLIILSNIKGAGIYAVVSEYVGVNLKHSIDIYKQMGMPEENIRMISDNMEFILYVFVRLIPSLVIASILFLSWINLLIAKPLFVKKALSYPDFGSLNLWKAPDQLVWLVIGSLCMFLIPDKAVRVFGINILIVMMPIYFFQGIAIVSFYFEKKRLPRGIRILLYSVIAFQYLAALFIAGLGFFDIWLNVRKIGYHQESGTSL